MDGYKNVLSHTGEEKKNLEEKFQPKFLLKPFVNVKLNTKSFQC